MTFISQLRYRILALGLASTLSGPGALAGVPFDQFIGFGASYDDSGQFPDLELGGKTGLRFTNIDPATGRRGLSMPEWLALDLGLGRMNPSTPLLVTGPRTDTLDTRNVNFAVGGYRSEEVLASVVGNSVVEVGPYRAEQPGFLARVSSGALRVGPDTLYYALIAGNDIRDVDDPVQTAEVSAQIAQALVTAGARYIVLPTLPKLGNFSEAVNLTPSGRTALAADRTAAAIAYNEAFEERLNGMRGNFIRIDVLRLFDEMLADPVGFGFPADIDQTRYCYGASEAGGISCVEPAGRGKSSGGSPDQFVFQDGLHPTQAASRGAADLMESVIRAPGLVGLLPESVLGDARAYLNTVDDYLLQNRWVAPQAAPQLFVSVQGRDADIDEAWSTPGASSDATDLSIGASMELGGDWLLGVSIGTQQQDVGVDGSGSRYDTSSLLGSAFAGYRHGDWFADAVLFGGRSDLEDITRVFELGSVLRRSESGDTEADVYGLSATVGVNMMAPDEGWRFGPFIGLDATKVEVDSYAENGLRSSTMQFGDMERDSTLGRAGVFAAYPLALGVVRLELDGDVAYAHEFDDQSDDVTAVVKSLASGPSFRMPGYAIDDETWRFALGAHATWPRGARIGLSYRQDDNDEETRYLNLSGSYRF